MDAIPPPYEYAVMRDALAIAAEYVPSVDLCAASLVSRRWHAIFNPQLWGNPASHFGTENDAVYVALTRFKRTLPYTRLEVRSLTHTIHLPPALSEIYGGPHATWLRDLLDYLPRLQSLIVSRLPFFDHNATISLRIPADPEQARRFEAYKLRLLLAEGEPNTTPIGIATALARFPLLVYLDLSHTSPAKDSLVLPVLSELPDLRVLKLRGIGLKDADAEFLANAISTRVRYLDVRNNLLTDRSVRSLLQTCFLPKEINQITDYRNEEGYYPSTALQSPELDQNILDVLTRPLTGRSIFESLTRSGITHLCIADNRLTVEGVAALLASGRLHFLDAGSVDTAQILKDNQPLLSPSGTNFEFDVVPGAEKLIPILGAYAKETLTYLRVNHAVVTKEAPSISDPVISKLLPELPVDNMDTPHSPAELDTTQQIYEMPAENDIPEMEDTSISLHPAPQPVSTATRNQYPDEPLPPRRGSIFAAEVVAPETSLEREESLRINHDLSTSDAVLTLRSNKIKELLAKRSRQEMSSSRQDTQKTYLCLHPSQIPRVRTLVLTDVPSHVSSKSPIISTLTRFISACADETYLAKLQARSNYSLPPGRDRAKVEQEYAKSLFALERLVLEITTAVRNTVPKIALSPWKSQHKDPYAAGNSTTGTIDSERFWSAAEDDFSFFGNEECGVPERPEAALLSPTTEKIRLESDSESTHSGLSELVGSIPLPAAKSPPCSSGLMPVKSTTDEEPSSSSSSSPSAEEVEVDLVAALASFRRARKQEYEDLRKNSHRSTSISESLSAATPTSPYPFNSLPLHVEGYWPGEVKVIRNPTPKGRSGVVDIFGNYFEKGYLYP